MEITASSRIEVHHVGVQPDHLETSTSFFLEHFICSLLPASCYQWNKNSFPLSLSYICNIYEYIHTHTHKLIHIESE